jgi:sugar diacid utilization regulator
VIADHLKGFSFESQFADPIMKGSLKGVLLFYSGMDLKTDQLYLSYASDLPEPQSVEAHYNIVCIGKPPEAYLKNTVNLLYLNSDTSLNGLFNAIEMIFQKFAQWEETLQSIFYQKKSIKALCEASLCVFENPISVYTSDLRLVCYAEKEKPDQLMLFNTSDTEKYMSIDEVNALKIDSEFIETIKSYEPTIFPKDAFGYRILLDNLRIQDIYVARICISETDQPIKKSDLFLIRTLSFYSELCLRHHDNEQYNNHPQNFDHLLFELLSNREVEVKLLHKYLDYYHWSGKDSFFCCQLPISSYEKSVLTANALSFQLSTNIKESCVIQFENAIVLLINLTRSSKTRNQHLGNLAYFIREGIIKAGVSEVFHEFSKLGFYYQQAKIAYQMGSVYDETLWCYRYENYALRFLIDRASEGYHPEVLCIPGLLWLREYDLKRSRNYCEVLKVYLENNMNIAKTIRVLYLQRGTFLYQLKRITEISGLDLADYQTRLHLMLSFEILEKF